MSDFLFKVLPKVLFAAAFVVLVVALCVVMYVTYTQPNKSFRLSQSEIGFVTVPEFAYSTAFHNDRTGPLVLMDASDGICYLSGVTPNAPGATAYVKESDNKWQLQNIGNITSQAICVRFKNKFQSPPDNTEISKPF